MNIHKNARLTPIGRERLVMAVLNGQPPEAAARAAGVCPRTARKWVERFQSEGRVGLEDRSSRPARLRHPTPDETVEKVIVLRRRRFTGQHIAAETGVSPATVSRILKRAGLSRVKDLEPEEPVHRYERSRPDEMLHIDIKKLGRFAVPGHRATGTRQGCRNMGAGWDFVHVGIDDHSRLAFSQIKPDEKAVSAIAFLEAAVAYYASLGVVIESVMTDNGSCYKSRDFAAACRHLNIRHIRTKPYTPQTNGKAERFIQTALREWLLRKNIFRRHRTLLRAAPLASQVQLAQTTWQPKLKATHQQAPHIRGQPIEVPQLAPETGRLVEWQGLSKHGSWLPAILPPPFLQVPKGSPVSPSGGQGDRCSECPSSDNLRRLGA